jgi:hypothetical protein
MFRDMAVASFWDTHSGAPRLGRSVGVGRAQLRWEAPGLVLSIDDDVTEREPLREVDAALIVSRLAGRDVEGSTDVAFPAGEMDHRR